METDVLQEVLISRAEDDGMDTSSKEEEPGTSSSHSRTGGSISYDRFRNPNETEESKRKGGDDRKSHQMKSRDGGRVGSEAATDPCNNIPSIGIRVQPPTAPSTTEDGMPVMYPRDADVLPTAILMTCCCPVCGCMAISLARKARRLRQAGKFHASAEATDASTWWAWSAALSGCFILLGFALSVMIFLLMIYA